MSTLFDELAEVEPEVAALLAAAEIRRLPPGTSHRPGVFGGASFLIVEHGFVVVRSATAERRGVVTCHGGAGTLLTAPEPGEILDALVEARVTLLPEALYADLLARPASATVLSDALRSTLRQEQDSIANFGSVRPIKRPAEAPPVARDHGRVVAGGVRLDFPVTHELLGEMIGSARETVSRALDRLERTGFVVREGRSYRLQVKPETIAT